MMNLERHSSSSFSQGPCKVKHFSYNPENRIGKGYSSVVYRGTNNLTNETIAVKAIDMKGVKDSASREMLDCQIEALTRLKHENILKCHDVVRERTHCYIITEFCDGGDLSVLLKKKKRFNEEEAMELTKGIVSGFIKIASAGFLHRDLKLANIFLSQGRAVIADFGFAKKHLGCFERERYNVGSPLYMSPEALRKNIYTVKNDIWSIGIMVYELLHGETPWECRTEKELMDKMVRIPVKFRQSLSISAEMKAFILKCLEVDEDKRMSLNDLIQWSQKILGEQLQPLKQVTNRSLSLNNHSRQPLTSKASLNQQSKQSHKNNASQQQSKFYSKETIPKRVFDRNNTLLIIEINTFRLLFKIYEKLRRHFPNETELANAIGNEVLKRVNLMMTLINPDKQNGPNSSSLENFGLVEVDSYLREETNPAIKKYKAVVTEYHKKYSREISNKPLGRQVTIKSLVKEVLSTGEMVKQDSKVEELTIVFWMIEFVRLGKDVTKEFLEGLIEMKNHTPTFKYLQDRIQAL